ncbi:TonB-dependent receptor plug domain-containing protein [Xanthomonas translucens]|uniref:TonB-dependent receptor plug domain-containing protein n=1 Tax=Xanthomonas campestris pv. translucens TaxID=343 RepID=UPI00272B1FB6|nr:TonB-dependent receptor plug domain-containing protein [Xanthomonas translucens]WLA12139.1 TonB-dependent receptor plug domain-containing protein [Xanthomonas translucens]
MSAFHPRAAAVRLSALSAGLCIALSAAAQPDAAADPTTLDAINVKAERARGYTVEQTAAATRLALTPQQTPQSLSIVTAQRIEDQHLTSVRDVLDNVSGVSSNAYDTERVLFYARGLLVENMAYDGVPVAPGINAGSADASLDTAIYERIEVLRGASGLLSGAGSWSAPTSRAIPTWTATASRRPCCTAWSMPISAPPPR